MSRSQITMQGADSQDAITGYSMMDHNPYDGPQGHAIRPHR